ncbi:hypothetical protein FRC07_005410 [Ceratobasidium sp. 392]|nr:hypothetical protein FRC07_005410 [Ceratobasidium sp. 392]
MSTTLYTTDTWTQNEWKIELEALMQKIGHDSSAIDLNSGLPRAEVLANRFKSHLSERFTSSGPYVQTTSLSLGQTTVVFVIILKIMYSKWIQ